METKQYILDNENSFKLNKDVVIELLFKKIV